MRVIDRIKFLYKLLLRGNKASSDTYMKYLRKKGVRIGDGCRFHDPATNFVDTDKPYMISIGNNVHITRGCTIVAHGYDWIVLRNLYGGNYGSAGKVTIGNNVFIGMNSTILKGAEIGNNVIIGAGSLVNSKIEDNCVVAGMPAKKIMSIEEYNEKRKNVLLIEAVGAYKAATERNVFEEIKSTWEFRWVYDATKENHYFDSYDDFVKYCNSLDN